jgi:conjugal transfer pilus assembly protein TrbC
MKNIPQQIALGGLTGLFALAGALAQSPGGIDLDAIRNQAQTQAPEAAALAAAARIRATDLAAEARQTRDTARDHGRAFAAAHASPTRATTVFDFDRMITDAGDMARQSMGDAPRFIAFASLSMPPESLRQMIDEVSKAGGVVVFRGLTQGSAKAMTQAFARILKPGESQESVGIDPRLFRAFTIKAVPAFVIVSSDFELCDGFSCVDSPPPFDMLSGNVTPRYALETVSRGGGPGALIAAQHLARLEGAQP